METIRQLIRFATTAAIEAGEAIMEVYESGEFEVEIKTDHSPLTKADKTAHKIISKKLADTGLPILSEEGVNIPFNERKNWNYFWLVDPLDGTKEFINRSGEFTVNIALMQMGIPVGGVIYAPCLKSLYVGSKETGVYKVKAGIETKVTPPVMRKSIESLLKTPEVIVVASKNHMNLKTEVFISKFKQARLVSMGSSLKLMLLVEGEADIYPRLGPTMEWDTAAGHAILKAYNMGIYQSNLIDELTYNKPDLLNPYFIAL